jgi:hypothetical protein
MPLVRYFFFVGGALLALLFIADASSPKLPVANQLETAIDLPIIRIHSDRKWPERVVFDTSTPAIALAAVPAPPAKTQASIPAPTIVADVSAGAYVRDAFAQFEPAYPKRPGPKPQGKRKVVKNRIGPPVVVVAQQPRPGLFANTW